eukprot:scaffold56186_cov31-Tisochrysis_lutea.AAC.3
MTEERVCPTALPWCGSAWLRDGRRRRPPAAWSPSLPPLSTGRKLALWCGVTARVPCRSMVCEACGVASDGGRRQPPALQSRCLGTPLWR